MINGVLRIDGPDLKELDSKFVKTGVVTILL